jgi:type IV pilus assembly protein PilB
MTTALPNLKSSTDEKNAIVKLVNRILLKAIEDRATHLYVEPQGKYLQVRIRKDGILQTALHNLPQNTIQPIVDCLKSLAEIDLSLPAPQKGIFDLNTKIGIVEISLVTLPSQFGDSIQGKFAYRQQLPPALSTLIADRDSLASIQKLIHRDRGLIVIAGEGDAGKSTTVYSCLAELNDPQKGIYTFDSRGNYTIPGITQVRLRDRQSRLEVIPTCLEQSPDLIFLGEIDSFEMAEMAIAAVDSGCLVFATIEARDVGTAIERLIHLDVPLDRFYTATVAVIAQKLVQQVCPECRLQSAPTIEELHQLGISALIAHRHLKYYRPHRLNLQEIEQAKSSRTLCPQCQGWGYRGRIGLYEILPITEGLQGIIFPGNGDIAKITIGEKINIAVQERGIRSFLDLAVDLLRSGQIDLLAIESCVSPKTLLQNQLTALDRSPSGNLLNSGFDLDPEASAAIYWQQEATETKAEHDRLLGELEKSQQEIKIFDHRLKQSRIQIEQSTRAEIAIQLLSIVDVIELARNSIKPQTDREAAIQKGYVMLESKILTCFREIGIDTIATKGQKFAPHLHEIVREEVNENYPAGTIVQEFKRGYLLGDRVLRLAQVKVAIASIFG